MIQYYAFQAITSDIEDNKTVVQVFNAGKITLLVTLRFDDDPVSDTCGRWVASFEFVSDTEDVPERSIVLYPDTVHFPEDDRYSVVIRAPDLDNIGFNDLAAVTIIIGVPNE